MTRERLAELKRILAEDDGPANDFSDHERFGTDGVLELIAAVEEGMMPRAELTQKLGLQAIGFLLLELLETPAFSNALEDCSNEPYSIKGCDKASLVKATSGIEILVAETIFGIHINAHRVSKS